VRFVKDVVVMAIVVLAVASVVVVVVVVLVVVMMMVKFKARRMHQALCRGWTNHSAHVAVEIHRAIHQAS
jgi:hypothetical protein